MRPRIVAFGAFEDFGQSVEIAEVELVIVKAVGPFLYQRVVVNVLLEVDVILTGVFGFGNELAINGATDFPQDGFHLRQQVIRRDAPHSLDARQVQATVERGGNGTHASPRLHWRRGHVRRQPYGTGRGQRKLIWIEPVLVGAGVSGNGNGGVV